MQVRGDGRTPPRASNISEISTGSSRASYISNVSAVSGHHSPQGTLLAGLLALLVQKYEYCHLRAGDVGGARGGADGLVSVLVC
jgi:hypothetical protein